jgi:hypothetical protein
MVAYCVHRNEARVPKSTENFLINRLLGSGLLCYAVSKFVFNEAVSKTIQHWRGGTTRLREAKGRSHCRNST